jgi:hypothetical protein
MVEIQGQILTVQSKSQIYLTISAILALESVSNAVTAFAIAESWWKTCLSTLYVACLVSWFN